MRGMRTSLGLISAALALWPVAASADVGVAVGAAPITLVSNVEAGGVYALPPLRVVNTGTESALFSVALRPPSPDPGRPVPATWLRFDRNDFTLSPNQGVDVPLQLAVPGDASVGSYSARLVAATTGRPDRGVVTLSVQAATVVKFTVAAAQPTGLALSLPVWVYVALGLAGLLAAGWLFGIRVEVSSATLTGRRRGTKLGRLDRRIVPGGWTRS